MRHEKICSVCNTHYQYCPNCDSYASKPRWMFLFCSENCKDIFETVSDYTQGRIDTRTAKKRLDKCDIQKAQPLKAGTKEGLEKINEAINRVMPRKKMVLPDPEPVVTEEETEVKAQPQEQRFKKRKHNKVSYDSDISAEALS